MVDALRLFGKVENAELTEEDGCRLLEFVGALRLRSSLEGSPMFAETSSLLLLVNNDDAEVLYESISCVRLGIPSV